MSLASGQLFFSIALVMLSRPLAFSSTSVFRVEFSSCNVNGRTILRACSSDRHTSGTPITSSPGTSVAWGVDGGDDAHLNLATKDFSISVLMSGTSYVTSPLSAVNALILLDDFVLSEMHSQKSLLPAGPPFLIAFLIFNFFSHFFWAFTRLCCSSKYRSILWSLLSFTWGRDDWVEAFLILDLVFRIRRCKELNLFRIRLGFEFTGFSELSVLLPAAVSWAVSQEPWDATGKEENQLSLPTNLLDKILLNESQCVIALSGLCLPVVIESVPRWLK